MKKIAKSYLKSYFKNWVEAIGLILYTIIVVAVIVGVISPSVQFLTKSNRLENNSGTFDGIFNIESSASNNNTNFQDNVVKKYYVDNVDWDNKKILKDNTIVDKTWFYENIIGDKIRSDTYITTNIIAKSLYPLFLLQPKEYNNVVKGLGITEEGFNYFKDNNFNFDYRIEMLHRIFKDVKGIEIVQNKAFFLEPLRGVSDLYYYINSTENININNLSYKNSFNKMHLFSGQKSNQNEIIINGKWAINNNIKVNEALDINNYKYKVSGLGSTLDAMIKTTKKASSENGGRYFSNNQIFIENYLQVFAQDDLFNKILKSFSGDYFLNDFSEFFIKFDKPSRIQDFNELLEPIFTQNGTSAFINYNDSDVAKSTYNFFINFIIVLSISLIVLFLTFIFINFAMKKEINNTKKQIGIFKAFGYDKKELSWVFALKFFVTITLGIIIGYVASLPLQAYSSRLYLLVLEIPFEKVYTGPLFLSLVFLALPAIFTITAYFLTLFYIKTNVTTLLKGATKGKATILSSFFGKIFRKTNFVFRVQVSFTFQNIGKWLAVTSIFFIASLLMVLTYGVNETIGSQSKNIFNAYDKDVKYYLNNSKEISVRNSLYEDKLQLGNKTNTIYEEFNGDLKDNPQVLREKESWNNLGLAMFLTISNHYDIDLEKLKISVKKEYEGNQEELTKVATNLIEVLNGNGTINPNDANIIYKTVSAENLVLFSYVINIVLQNGLYDVPTWINQLLAISLLEDLENTHVSFNKLYYDTNITSPTLRIKTKFIPNTTKFSFNHSLVSFEQQQVDSFYNFKGITQTKLNEIFTKAEKDEPIPAVISYRIARMLNLKEGDIFSIQERTVEDIYKLNIKAVHINNHDTTGNRMFAMYENISSKYVDRSGNNIKDKELYSGLISKEKILQSKVNIENFQNIKFKMNRLMFSFSNLFPKDVEQNLSSVTLSQVLGLKPLYNKDGKEFYYNSNRNSKFVINPLNSDPIELYKAAIEQGLNITLGIMFAMQILISIVILIILVVITTSIIDEAIQVLLTMRAIGYKSGQINFIVIGNYIIGILLSFIFAYFISFGVWTIINSIIFNLSGIVLPLPISWLIPVITGGTIAGIVAISWAITLNMVSHKKLSNLTDL